MTTGSISFHFIRLITIFFSFIIHFKKSQSYKKEQKKCSKTRCKNKKLGWEMGYCYTFDSILQGFSRKRFDFYQQFGFFLFCFKVFWLFFFELNIFFKFSNNGIKYFTTECLFSALLYKTPVNCSLDQLESHKRDLYHQKPTCEVVALSPFLSVLFDLIFSLSFLYFQIFRCSL